MCPIRILLVEDHKLVREGTRQLLEQVPELAVIGEAADGPEAVRLAEALIPDVVVMDVRLQSQAQGGEGMSGIEATRIIKARYPRMRVLILSAYEDDRFVFPLLEAGANGYLLKTASGAELANAIRTVYMGATALDPHIAGKVVNRVARGGHGPHGPHAQLYRSAEMKEGLSERELEVLHAAAQGKSNRQIGEMLSISPHTVQVHLRNIFGKMGVNDRTEAVAYALTQGWIDLEAPLG